VDDRYRHKQPYPDGEDDYPDDELRDCCRRREDARTEN